MLFFLSSPRGVRYKNCPEEARSLKEQLYCKSRVSDNNSNAADLTGSVSAKYNHI